MTTGIRLILSQRQSLPEFSMPAGKFEWKMFPNVTLSTKNIRLMTSHNLQPIIPNDCDQYKIPESNLRNNDKEPSMINAGLTAFKALTVLWKQVPFTSSDSPIQ